MNSLLVGLNGGCWKDNITFPLRGVCWGAVPPSEDIVPEEAELRGVRFFLNPRKERRR